MRLGCTGCLTGLIALGVIVLGLSSAIGLGTRMLKQPDIPVIETTAADGSRAQQKLFDLGRRRRAIAETVTITEPELNALLTRHLVEARGVQLRGSSARLLGGDRLEVTAYRPLGRILQEVSLSAVARVLPASWRERPIWFRVGAHIRVDEEPPRHLLLDVDALAIGRQRVPALTLRLLLDPGGVGLLRWSLPSHIESVTIEPGRAVIRTIPERHHASLTSANLASSQTPTVIMTRPPGTDMTQSPGVLFERLLDIMHRLRGPDGCPWDREQTRTSLKPYLIEEAYEVLEAIEAGQVEGLREELGDLLFQVVFHAEIGGERGEFTMADVLARLGDKMISRHPHVFGDARVESPAQALTQWEAIKQREAQAQGRRRSIIDGVPRALPGLVRAQRIQSKAARVNFDWPDAQAAWAKVEEEAQETSAALAAGDRTRIEEELGDMLFSLVNVARLASLDAEEALQRAIEKFRRRFATMEDDLNARGTSMGSVSPEELERSWQAVKAQERGR